MGLKDVMIGDWVWDKENDCPWQINIKDFRNGGNNILFFEPIPLTTEILERNLHEPDEGVVWWKNDEPFYHVECLPLNGMRLIMPYTQYVHELQHLLRLAGIDKEIKLED